ncbi:hypothetical protein DFJ58DRAFT_371881 [Suillus subalutaceus]|uniref:uncharacterized protein n=1 Tax=Suillus subalutaceus TaxID=48586 RepID=UPI001B85C554|nr:uncharacterized protein DFJ58DRAFT_371881 [Suillus subalutaceus]KAG1854948.1 hypothetical protein DFJ58DRAFT_371881 [Suillus subalutaceus]
MSIGDSSRSRIPITSRIRGLNVTRKQVILRQANLHRRRQPRSLHRRTRPCLARPSLARPTTTPLSFRPSSTTSSSPHFISNILAALSSCLAHANWFTRWPRPRSIYATPHATSFCLYNMENPVYAFHARRSVRYPPTFFRRQAQLELAFYTTSSHIIITV